MQEISNDNEKLTKLFQKRNFHSFDVSSLTKNLIEDMNLGLSHQKDADHLMIQATKKIPSNIPFEKKIIVIDAGGTNFRSCTVTINKDGTQTIQNLNKTFMPASDRRLSKKEFYAAIARNIEYLKNESDTICFCFSYAIQITEDGDGKILTLSKQIDAPEIKGTLVGQELLKELNERGWKTVNKITIVNDTLAALLSGMTLKNKYDSYIGFILGTGINNAYIERNFYQNNESIVVCESGCFCKIPQSDYDKTTDLSTINPGKSILEKMCSGAYEGKVCWNLLQDVAKEKLFTESDSQIIESIKEITPYDMDITLTNKDKTSQTENDTETVFSKTISTLSPNGKKLVIQCFTKIIERTATIVASVICATIIKSLKNDNSVKNICIVCNGSTFWKTYGLSDQVKLLTQKYLTQNPFNGQPISFDFVKIENDITIGTAISYSIYK